MNSFALLDDRDATRARPSSRLYEGFDRDQIRLFLTRERDLDLGDFVIDDATRPDVRESRPPALRGDSRANDVSATNFASGANITEHPGRPLHRN